MLEIDQISWVIKRCLLLWGFFLFSPSWWLFLLSLLAASTLTLIASYTYITEEFNLVWSLNPQLKRVWDVNASACINNGLQSYLFISLSICTAGCWYYIDCSLNCGWHDALKPLHCLYAPDPLQATTDPHSHKMKNTIHVGCRLTISDVIKRKSNWNEIMWTLIY